MKKNREQTYDVIVIGGGITGAGTARDCAMRGLNLTSPMVQPAAIMVCFIVVRAMLLPIKSRQESALLRT